MVAMSRRPPCLSLVLLLFSGCFSSKSMVFWTVFKDLMVIGNLVNVSLLLSDMTA